MNKLQVVLVFVVLVCCMTVGVEARSTSSIVDIGQGTTDGGESGNGRSQVGSFHVWVDGGESGNG